MNNPVWTLQQLGWSEELERQFSIYKALGCIPGRVALEHTHMYRIYTEQGELLGTVSGKMRFEALDREAYPAVGDWVAVSMMPGEERAIIHSILPRFSKFSRKAAGNTTDEQIVAANVNTIFLVAALNNDFNVSRLERYLILAWESGANPVIVLSKADLCESIDEKLAELEATAFGVPVHVVSALAGEGIEQLAPYLAPGKTVALLGSSGCGKSTLTNKLVGAEIQKVNDIRQGDDRGRHTTTHRELVVTREGAMLVDTPGMRELQLWSADEGIRDAFSDVEELAKQCQFHDCRHGKEPGCAVKRALSSGKLDRSRLESFRKLERELTHLAEKEKARLRIAEKKHTKRKPGKDVGLREYQYE